MAQVDLLGRTVDPETVISIGFADRQMTQFPNIKVFAHRVPGSLKYTIVRRDETPVNQIFTFPMETLQLQPQPLNPIMSAILNNNLANYHAPDRGVTPAVLEKLESVKIEDNSELLGEKCTVCLETFQKGEKVIILECKHSFHSNCILRYFHSNNKCPHCRREY